MFIVILGLVIKMTLPDFVAFLPFYMAFAFLSGLVCGIIASIAR